MMCELYSKGKYGQTFMVPAILNKYTYCRKYDSYNSIIIFIGEIDIFFKHIGNQDIGQKIAGKDNIDKVFILIEIFNKVVIFLFTQIGKEQATSQIKNQWS